MASSFSAKKDWIREDYASNLCRGLEIDVLKLYRLNKNEKSAKKHFTTLVW